jgi:hypothetical protein
MHNQKINSSYNMNQKKERGSQNYNHCGLYIFKNQKFGSKAQFITLRIERYDLDR